MGDLRLQALANYCTFKDFNLVKRCLYMFAAVPREDGSLPACVFEKPKLSAASDYIVDYDALFGPTVYDYAVASGDTETAIELWPTVLKSMNMALAHLTDIHSGSALMRMIRGEVLMGIATITVTAMRGAAHRATC